MGTFHAQPLELTGKKPEGKVKGGEFAGLIEKNKTGWGPTPKVGSCATKTV